MSKELEDKLLNEDPDSQAIEADDDAYYSPDQDNESVVVTEPEIITIGRGVRKSEMRKMQQADQPQP